MFQARITRDIAESVFQEGDLVAVTGAVQAADSRPYLIAVRCKDGVVDLVMTYQVIATDIVWPDGEVTKPESEQDGTPNHRSSEQ